MTLHPDVLTDLVILYHAGEASQATRELLEAEAATNPQIRAALTAPPRAPAALPVDPPDSHRTAIRDIRVLFRRRQIFSCAMALLLGLAVTVPRLRHDYPWLPFATLLVIWGVAFFTLRAHNQTRRLL